jgi:hypothetical protein
LLHLCSDGRKRRRVCGASVDVAGIREGVKGDTKMGVADLQGSGSFMWRGDTSSSTMMSAELSWSRNDISATIAR